MVVKPNSSVHLNHKMSPLKYINLMRSIGQTADSQIYPCEQTTLLEPNQTFHCHQRSQSVNRGTSSSMISHIQINGKKQSSSGQSRNSNSGCHFMHTYHRTSTQKKAVTGMTTSFCLFIVE